METLIKQEKDLKDLSHKILEKIKENKNNNRATIVGLFGDLGSGKTTFTKYFAEQLGIDKSKIISPTFIIQKKFPIKKNTEKDEKTNVADFKNLYHLDVYRIENPKEILNLDWEDINSDPHNLIFIEWADLIEEILPSDTLKINFETIDETTRKITTSF